MAFAQALKRWRRHRFLSQRALAEALGVSLTTVQRWEMGRTRPFPATQARLVEVLALAPDEFLAALGGADAEQPVDAE